MMPDPEQGSSWATIATVITSVAGSLGLTGLGAWLWKIWRQKHTDTSADHLGTIAEYRQLLKDQRAELKEMKEIAAEFRNEMQEREDKFRSQSEARFDSYRTEAHARAGALQSQISTLTTAHRICERENAMLGERMMHMEARLNFIDPKKTGDAVPRLP